MGYYCTVPQCTSLAGKTKNVKFHRFPRDTHMAEKWNTILKRGKPVTIYSKVCSLHFTQADYNVTTMGKNKGQWKTLSKDAIPTQNLPKLNPDGTVMVIRKSRIVKYKDIKKEDISDDLEKWSPLPTQTEPPNVSAALQLSDPHANYIYRLQEMNAMAKAMSSSQDPLPLQITPRKPKKQDAFMQTDPIKYDEDDSQMNANFETQKSYTPDLDYQYKPLDFEESKYIAKDYTKENDYTQTNEEYNEAEKYALERKSHTAYDKIDYQKSIEYDKIPEVYTSFDEKEFETRQGYVYENSYPDSVDMLRNQQQNLQLLQDQHRVNENQNFFNENHIKQEIDFNNDEEKFLYERNKDPVVSAPNTPSTIYESPRIMDQISQQVKQEPDASNGCETVVQPQESPYYNSTEHNINGCYPQVCRPGPELLIAKQNALAAHTQLWQNTMKRPFFYSESPRYNTPTIIHRYEDLSRILQ